MINDNDKFNISLDEWYKTVSLEVELKSENSFLLIVETLTRMGILSNNSNKLFQSCHILFKRDKYYIVHFKELFALDGRSVNLTKEDIGRRNLIATLLEEWGMINLVEPHKAEDKLAVSSIKVVKHSDKIKYELVSKYQIGNKGVK